MRAPLRHASLSPADRSRRLRWLCGALTFLLVVATWSLVCFAPNEEWNGARLLPSFLLVSGERIYNLPLAGPEILWSYGPVTPIVYIPAALLGHILPITQTILVFAVLNVGWTLIPAGLCIIACARRSGQSPLAGVLAALGFWATLIAAPGTRMLLAGPLCDQVAMGLAALSCLLLAAHLERKGPWLLHAAAALSILSVWTKQIEIFVPLAQLAALAALGRRDRCPAYVRSLFYASAACLLIFGWIFGLGEMTYNMWTILAGHPLKGGAAYLGMVLLRLSAYVVPGTALWLGMRRRLKAAHPLSVLLVASMLALVPISVIGASKLGGGENSFHSGYLAMVVAWIAIAALPSRWSVTLSTATCLLVTAWVLHAPWFRATPDHFMQGEMEIAQAHPGAAYFPRNPLITWLSDHRVYHLEEGIVEEAVAGYPMPKQRFWEYMPAHLRLIVYPAGYFKNPPITFIIPHGPPREFGNYQMYPVPAGTAEKALLSASGRK